MRLSLLLYVLLFAPSTAVTLSTGFVVCCHVAVFEVNGLIYFFNDLSPPVSDIQWRRD
jgi:hypothetical protein